METVMERVSNPAIALPLVLLVTFSVYRRLAAAEAVPAGVPWIGKDSSKLFSETRAALQSFNRVRQWLNEGYEKYSKEGKTYVFPDFSGQPEVIVPRSQASWLLDQPDSVLSTSAYHYDTLEGSYSFTDPSILEDPYHEHVIHKYLPRRLGGLVPGMWDELNNSFDSLWGMDSSQWKEIGVFDNLMVMIPRAVNRMFIGLPSSRNTDYLSNMTGFAMDVITAATLFLRFTPRWLKPILGPLFTMSNTRHWRKSQKYTVPIIKERLANIKRKKQDPSFEWEEPNDYLSWHIELATAEDRQDELTPDRISRRLMPLNFAAIHTTTLTITNCLFDIISSDPAKGIIEGLREEAERVYGEEGGQWTKAGLARLHRADSAIRESMRVSNFMTRGVLRKVLPEEGIENKIEGWRAPKGAYIGLDVHSVQHDPEVYPDPDSYDAFRFSRPKEGADTTTAENGNAANGKAGGEIIKHNVGLITTSQTFLPFGHGRHACPGRFFVALELKMLLAKMVMDYDVEPLPTRPPSKWFGSNLLPPMKATIKVRRREGTVKAKA